MNSQALITNILRARGTADAQALRETAADLDGTALIAQEEKIPAFDPQKDYSAWPVGAPVTDDGQVYALLQPYHAANYEGRPLTLRALWSLCHTKDPEQAKPWVEPLGTSGLYMKDEVCTDPQSQTPEAVWCSLVDNNAYSPSAYPQNWARTDEGASA